MHGFDQLIYDPILSRIRLAAGPVAPGRVYVVGGYLRDRLLGCPAESLREVDLVTTEELNAFVHRLGQRLGGRVVSLDPDHRRLMLDAGPRAVQVDVARLRGSTIDEDLAARDFTLDALALDIAEPRRLIDPCDGLTALAQRRLTLCAPSALDRDPVRLLRGVRLAASRRLAIPTDTEYAMAASVGLLANSPGERVREELVHLLAMDAASPWVEWLDQHGALEVLFPVVCPMKETTQGSPHCFEVWTHSLLTLRALEGLWRGPVVKGLARAPIALTAGLDDPVDGAISRGILLKLVALFHDVGKVGTRRQVGTGPIRFPGHAEAGATLFAVIAGRLALGRRPTERGAQAIRHHLRPLMLSQGPQVTRRVAYRFFRDVRPVAEEVLCLGLADNWAKAWRKGRTFVRVERTVRALLAFAPLLTRPTHLLDGHAIQTVLGIGPGPLVGYLLRIVQERGALGELRSAEEAVAFLLAQRESLEKAFREGEVHGGGP